MKKTLAILTVILAFASCEECMDLDLDCDETVLVIEGSINNLDKKSVITLSETTDFLMSGDSETVSSAIVEVTDDNGLTFGFEETEPGIYTSENMQGVENTTYTLNVMSKDENYRAKTRMPQKVDIDYLSFEDTLSSFDFQGGYMVNCHFQDPVEQENYYRLKVYHINDEFKADDSKFVFTDEFVNGNELAIQWEIEQFMPNDIIVVELQNLDKSTYEYYHTSFSITEGGFGNLNLETNIDNDALGCFLSFAISRDTVLIMSE